MKKAIIFGYHEVGCILVDELIRNNIKVSLIVGIIQNMIHKLILGIEYKKIAHERKIKILEVKTLKQNKIRNLIKKLNQI